MSGAIGTLDQPQFESQDERLAHEDKNRQKSIAVEKLKGRSLLASVNWCTCSLCAIMPLDAENYCCRESEIMKKFCDDNSITCITEHEDIERFVIYKRCLNMMRNEKVLHGRQRFRRDDDVIWRYVAYSTFMKWLRSATNFGNADPSVRYVIPACMVTRIRQQYPSPNNTYVGFMPKQQQNPHYPA